MNFRKLLLTIFATGMFITTGAVPAKRGLFTVIQPDGTTLRVQRVGDEHLHFLLTEDDMLLVKQDDGTYCYSRIDEEGICVSTGVAATPVEMRTDQARSVMMSFDRVSPAEIRTKRLETMASGISTRPSRAIAQNGMGCFTGTFPRKGKIKGLVILVRYADEDFTLEDPYSYFHDMLNREGFDQYGGTGSARDYFLANSNGQFDPEFDVYGPYTLPKNRKYYGGNNSAGDDQAPEEMVVDACKGLDSEINFADYDMDGDGYVDNVFVFYAGRGEASGGDDDTVWPHQWDLWSAGKSLMLDGVKISKYACTNEWESFRPDGVGTFIHEFSHVMGLPDLYETTYSGGNVTPGEWSVLDYGPYNNNGRTPPNYSIFERNAMGWCEPRVLDAPETVTLENIAKSNDACIVPTTKTTEFFLIENRQQEGWDAYLPGHGMLIWHIDFVQRVWDSNAVNNTAGHMYVELEKASNLSSNSKGWSYPGVSGNTSFTNETKPSMKTWNGTNIDMPITEIAEKEGLITFNIAGGGRRLDAPVVDSTPVMVDNGFVVSWSPVEGATDYVVTVRSISDSPVVEHNYDSSIIPQGWTQSDGIGYYDTNTNFVTGTRSLKFSETGHTLTTCNYENDIDYISFWCKGMNTLGSVLVIEGNINGQWKEIYSCTPSRNKGATIEIPDVEQGVKSVRFVYTKLKGNIALDDITVRTKGDSGNVLNGYDEVSTGGATSINVDLSKEAATMTADGEKYLVSVKATFGSSYSRASTILVTKTSPAGVDDVTTDAGVTEYFNLQGIRVDNPQRGQIYIMRRNGVVSKVVF